MTKTANYNLNLLTPNDAAIPDPLNENFSMIDYKMKLIETIANSAMPNDRYLEIMKSISDMEKEIEDFVGDGSPIDTRITNTVNEAIIPINAKVSSLETSVESNSSKIDANEDYIGQLDQRLWEIEKTDIASSDVELRVSDVFRTKWGERGMELVDLFEDETDDGTDDGGTSDNTDAVTP